MASPASHLWRYGRCNLEQGVVSEKHPVGQRSGVHVDILLHGTRQLSGQALVHQEDDLSLRGPLQNPSSAQAVARHRFGVGIDYAPIFMVGKTYVLVTLSKILLYFTFVEDFGETLEYIAFLDLFFEECSDSR